LVGFAAVIWKFVIGRVTVDPYYRLPTQIVAGDDASKFWREPFFMIRH
jgi:hypothetical protein